MPQHRSPALTAIVNEVQRSSRNRVLDLGEMSAGCFNLFSTLSCHIQVEDLRNHIIESLASGNDAPEVDMDECFIAYESEAKFDVVLAWDVFNYLAPDELRRLINKISMFFKPNTLIYMMRYTGKAIPEFPREINVSDKYMLTLQELETPRDNIGRCSTMSLLKNMRDCNLQETFIAESGMLEGITEHVVRYQESREKRFNASKTEIAYNSASTKIDSYPIQEQHHSYAIKQVVDALGANNSARILDLGSAISRKSDYLVQQASLYQKIDLFQKISLHSSDETLLYGFEKTLHSIGQEFDYILVWDLFNYIAPDLVEKVCALLNTFCHPTSELIVFMYAGTSVPNSPGKFFVAGDGHINIGIDALVPREAMFTGASLIRKAEGFQLNASYAYRAGMNKKIIEYSFRLRDKGRQPLS